MSQLTDHRYVHFVVITIRSFPHSSFTTSFVFTKLTQRAPLVKQILLILPFYMSLLPMFCSVSVAQSLVFCVVFCGSLLVILSLFYWLSVLSSTLLITTLVSSEFFFVCRKLNKYMYASLHTVNKDTNMDGAVSSVSIETWYCR